MKGQCNGIKYPKGVVMKYLVTCYKDVATSSTEVIVALTRGEERGAETNTTEKRLNQQQFLPPSPVN